MLSAVGGALKSIRLDDRHYAVCAAQTDAACPHVHVAVSRVDPETGRAVNLDSRATKRLSRWAEQYERDHGGIVVPTRVERLKAQAARRDLERRTPGNVEKFPKNSQIVALSKTASLVSAQSATMHARSRASASRRSIVSPMRT